MTLKAYKSYLFKDKDPVIDEVRTMFEKRYNRRVDHAMLHDVEDSGGPSAGCMSRWFFGDTKRPQTTTIEAAGRTLGFQRRWVKMKAPK